jgi:Icc protein
VYRILHLSDTHLTASGLDEDGVDARGSLAGLLHDIRHVSGVDLVVVSGDVADDGSAAGYEDARQQIGAYAGERGIPVVFATGNHDNREHFAEVLGSGHLDVDGSDNGRLFSAEKRAAVSDRNGLRVITLDSLVPGAAHGEIGADQLAWLRRTLSEPAPLGSVVLFHHPPVTLDIGFHQGIALQDPAELGEVIAGSDVHVILCGHFHHQLMGTLAGIPVLVAPGVVTRLDLTAPGHLMRGLHGAGAVVVDIGGPGELGCHLLQARDPRAGELAYLYDPANNQHVTTEAG